MNTENSGQGILAFPSFVPLTDRVHLCLSKLGAPVSGPFGHPPFAPSITQIVHGCSEKQMLRVHTPPVIAVVAHLHPCRDGTMCELVGESMGTDGMAMYRKLPVPVGEGACCP